MEGDISLQPQKWQGHRSRKTTDKVQLAWGPPSSHCGYILGTSVSECSVQRTPLTERIHPHSIPVVFRSKPAWQLIQTEFYRSFNAARYMGSSSRLTSQPTKALYPFPDGLGSLESLTPGYHQYHLEDLLSPCVIGESRRPDQPQILESGQRRLRRITLPQPRQPFLEAEWRYIALLGK